MPFITQHYRATIPLLQLTIPPCALPVSPPVTRGLGRGQPPPCAFLFGESNPTASAGQACENVGVASAKSTAFELEKPLLSKAKLGCVTQPTNYRGPSVCIIRTRVRYFQCVLHLWHTLLAPRVLHFSAFHFRQILRGGITTYMYLYYVNTVTDWAIAHQTQF